MNAPLDHVAEAEKRVGALLGDAWTLEKLIGVGGMAAVYVGRHLSGRREAIKILHPDVATIADVRARFEQEAFVVDRFHHPGAVEVRDVGLLAGDVPFLVMELLEGETLAERARRLGAIPIDELLGYVDELLDVLAAAHAQGIIHRDIKPDNLFVLASGRLKVLDFGIARLRDGVPPALRTRAGVTLGTASFMPPEQIKGLEIDARADLFAVGATMFRLITGRRMHEAGSEAELLVKMASLPAPKLATVAPEAPRAVALVVDRALELDPEARYPDAATMQRDVRAARAGEAPPYATAQLEADEVQEAAVSSRRAAAAAAPQQETTLRSIYPEPAPPSTRAVSAFSASGDAPRLSTPPPSLPPSDFADHTKRSEEPPPSISPDRVQELARARADSHVDVVAPPPLPERARSSALRLVIVGVVFAALGAGGVLWALRGQNGARGTPPAPTASPSAPASPSVR